MTRKPVFKIFVLFFVCALAFKSFGQIKQNDNLVFVQGDSLFVVFKNSDTILLERKPFAMRYFCKQYDSKNEKFYAAQIAVLENPMDTLQLKLGQKTQDITYFEPGTGMAPGENELYDAIFITNMGHHYLTYENENQKRAFLVSKTEDKLELEWKITTAFYEEKDVQFKDLKLPFLFFVVYKYMDRIN